jgi:hypothetical protein
MPLVSWFKGPTRKPEPTEPANLEWLSRQLADVLFMLRDYPHALSQYARMHTSLAFCFLMAQLLPIALSVLGLLTTMISAIHIAPRYRKIANDRSEKNMRYAPAAVEMSGVTAFMQDYMRKDIEGELDRAYTMYQRTAQPRLWCVRVTSRDLEIVTVLECVCSICLVITC